MEWLGGKQAWPLEELGLISVFPLHVFKSYLEKMIATTATAMGFKWIMQVNVIASIVQGT